MHGINKFGKKTMDIFILSFLGDLIKVEDKVATALWQKKVSSDERKNM